jgi:Ni/Co efflux regulator RcnB
MKRAAFAIVAALALAAPLASTAFADPPGWDDHQHNGYTYKGQWHYGPPPSGWEKKSGYSVGYHAWKKGDKLPTYYKSHYNEVDWHAHHLKAPPKGYHYVQDDKGEIILAAVATGLIASIIANS